MLMLAFFIFACYTKGVDQRYDREISMRNIHLQRVGVAGSRRWKPAFRPKKAYRGSSPLSDEPKWSSFSWQRISHSQATQTLINGLDSEKIPRDEFSLPSLGAKDRHAGVLPNISHSEASQLGWHREGMCILSPSLVLRDRSFFILLRYYFKEAIYNVRP